MRHYSLLSSWGYNQAIVSSLVMRTLFKDSLLSFYSSLSWIPIQMLLILKIFVVSERIVHKQKWTTAFFQSDFWKVFPLQLFLCQSLFCLVASLCSQFISPEKKNVVYGFLMWRYLIKIPLYLLRLRSMSHAGPLWWHHIVVEAFPLGRLADLCLCDTTPSLHPHTAHTLANTHTYCFLLGTFQVRASVCSFLLSQHAHAFLSPPLHFPRKSTSSHDLLDSRCWWI